MDYSDLPHDVLQYIMLLSPYKTVESLCKVSKKHFCDDKFWKLKIDKDFAKLLHLRAYFYSYWTNKETYLMLQYCEINNFTIENMKLLSKLDEGVFKSNKFKPININNILLGLKEYPEFFSQDIDELLFEAIENTGGYGNKAVVDYLLLMAKIRNETDTDNTYENVIIYAIYGIIYSNNFKLFEHYFHIYQNNLLKSMLISNNDIKRNYENDLVEFFRRALIARNVDVVIYLLDQGYENIMDCNSLLSVIDEFDGDQRMLDIINLILFKYNKLVLVPNIIDYLLKTADYRDIDRDMLLPYMHKLLKSGTNARIDDVKLL